MERMDGIPWESSSSSSISYELSVERNFLSLIGVRFGSNEFPFKSVNMFCALRLASSETGGAFLPDASENPPVIGIFS